jgi:ionotropic glutamate receptor NMDA 3A
VYYYIKPTISVIQLLSQRVGTPRASAADYYVHRSNPHLWEHMQKYAVVDVEDGIQHLK